MHESLKEQEILRVKELIPEAEIILHPEVNPLVARHAHKLLSTGGMLKYASMLSGKKMIIGTEMGLLYRLQKLAPQNQYYNVGRDLVCPNMKKIRMEHVIDALRTEANAVILSP